jgi:hypothetical protein
MQSPRKSNNHDGTPDIEDVHPMILNAYRCFRGAIETPLLMNLGSKELLDDVLVSNIAARRMAKPDEITRVILFMLSEDAAYMTGSVRQTHPSLPDLATDFFFETGC